MILKVPSTPNHFGILCSFPPQKSHSRRLSLKIAAAELSKDPSIPVMDQGLLKHILYHLLLFWEPHPSVPSRHLRSWGAVLLWQPRNKPINAQQFSVNSSRASSDFSNDWLKNSEKLQREQEDNDGSVHRASFCRCYLRKTITASMMTSNKALPFPLMLPLPDHSRPQQGLQGSRTTGERARHKYRVYKWALKDPKRISNKFFGSC